MFVKRLNFADRPIKTFSKAVCCKRYSEFQNHLLSSDRKTQMAVARGERITEEDRHTSSTEWSTLGAQQPVWLFST